MSGDLERNESVLENSANLQSLCRVCLSENVEQSKSVFDEYKCSNIASVVMLCARVQIVSQDGLPDVICAQCLRDLEAANSFRVRCELSDSLLRKAHNNPDQGEVRMKGEVTETQDVNEEVPCEQWIKSELNEDSECDPESSLVENESTLFQLGEIDTTSNLFEKKKKMCLNVRKNGKDKFICNICGRPMSTKRSLENHIHSMHSANRKPLMGNVTGYGKSRKFHCSECSYSTPWKKTLIYHSRTHTGEKPYVCDICNDRFTQPGSLNSHKRLHSDKMYYTCPDCGKQFKLKQSYREHKRVHNDAKNFVCEICNKGLKTQKSLSIHTKRHLNIRDYSCEQCGLTFVTFENLLNHSKKHADTKKYECNLCSYKTRSKQTLIVHLERHKGVKKFKCEECGYMGFDIYALRMHMRKHTQEKKYSCPICELKFIHSPSLNSHMKKIHSIDYKVNDHADRRLIK